MRLPIQRIRMGALVTLLLATTGCAMQEAISDRGVEYNLAIEEAHNKMLLLNVVRAMLRRPMHYSAISQIQGGLSSSVNSGAFTIPFGRNTGNPFQIGPTVSGGHSPTINFQVLRTQAFVRGITTPVAMKTFHLLVEQGWSRELLFRLLVKEVCESANRCFENRLPFNKRFEHYAKGFTRIDRKEVTLGAPLELEVATNVSELRQIEAAGLSLRPVAHGGKWKLVAERFDYEIVTDVDGEVKTFAADQRGLSADRAFAKIRSPEAVLFYLGEVAAAGLGLCALEVDKQHTHTCEAPSVPTTAVEAKRQDPVFILQTGEPTESPLLEVAYEGETYWIPESKGARAITALSLVNLLIGLNTEASDLPGTATTILVGGQ